MTATYDGPRLIWKWEFVDVALDEFCLGEPAPCEVDHLLRIVHSEVLELYPCG